MNAFLARNPIEHAVGLRTTDLSTEPTGPRRIRGLSAWVHRRAAPARSRAAGPFPGTRVRLAK